MRLVPRSSFIQERADAGEEVEVWHDVEAPDPPILKACGWWLLGTRYLFATNLGLGGGLHLQSKASSTRLCMGIKIIQNGNPFLTLVLETEF